MTSFKQWLKGVGKYDLVCITNCGLIGWIAGGAYGALIGLMVCTLVDLTYVIVRT